MKTYISFLIITVTFLISCKKDIKYDHLTSVNSDVFELKTKYKELASVIISTAIKNKKFKKIVYDECIKEKFGDYYVRIDELIALNKSYTFWDNKTVQILETLQNDIKNKTERNVTIFIPSMENIKLKVPLNNNSLLSKENNFIYDETLYTVIADEYLPTDQTCPGYVVNTDGNLSYYQTIDESFAWENDVWVFGQEEGDPTNDTTLNILESDRANGQTEFGAIIQITDFSQIEPWVTGKVELKYFVYNAFGTIIKEKEFPKTKRKNIKAPTWKDYGDFITNWNTNNIGNWMIEGWVEQDNRGSAGGNTTSISQSFPSACTGCPSTSIGYTIKKTDYDMGRTIIQFSDPISQIYGISYANVKRKN